ncbi:MAG TPA: DAK2 domain-containing protein, partial [Ktedonobacterales bacterium]
MARSFFSRFSRTRARHISVFNGQDLKHAIMAGHLWLEEHREAINALNVFPVPDGDTGTNMSLTMRAAVKEIEHAEDLSAAVIAEKLSRGALMGARGNSGVILSQILRGLSHGLEGKSTFTAQDFAAALQESSRMAYRAVIKPVEGTILTVIRECAEAAQQSAANGSDITTMLEDTVHAAHATVAKTPDLLPTLKQAGVVDAGGQGLATLLEGIWRYARGDTIEMTPREQREEEA